ncbi:hypothetical protein [Streptomyces sp. NPDC127072]|uniref:hypothetical protein n=1 Tax=Streptomyces sp. NPDC127072 TaxID=3347129 RepID=UPI0036524590
MADRLDILPFKTLVTQAGAVLLTHGVEVEATSVRGVAEHLVEAMAQQVGMDHAEAVHLVTPEAVAEIIMKAASEDDQGVSGPHAVRPVRIDDRTVSAPVESLGTWSWLLRRPASTPASTMTERLRLTSWISLPRLARPS